ncbi:bifunctional acetate--CoA ligase family protein/GNAT family N-acetyltransferase [Reyranella sp. MMS21-HV4-11]|uniref:Bifunctional acetate--CoA ligase family protein/GNAT family N-acetyltransferase n=1 Tax=Reyranella humidisoli TaxID=2849149 RepID=A0ABS6IR91_9HYPH|nr:bifunctional acetate--CoA ligase family protein/GNAT family N-acetyltransferase [Reyranella sp. MMS21-HV4-11]MBU8877111.1 bifunctional acetate--CoA ligase family protein/GNAT family N-acetyltransferase [Reyranella sp. MMS21-HV4-11]
MSTRNLDSLMAPRSVVAIGASERPGSVGAAVTHNLLAGGFKGDIHLVNRKGGTIAGRTVFKRVSDLPEPADLAVIMTPAETIPALITALGQAGTHAAVVISAGPGSGPDAGAVNARWRQRLLNAAKPHLLRIIGPNCIGYAAPGLGLNASFGPTRLKGGRIAAVAQSGAVLAGLADWGVAQGIGFSHLISMGDMADVDFGDVLDMLARDLETRAVLMYVEGITQARKFMSAARGLARIKPVIVLKGGRHAAAAQATASHTGSMAGSAAVYDAAFARAGLVRVLGLGELFDAAETLGHSIAPRSERLAILTNGGGAGIIATDLLMDEGGELATLLPRTIGNLDKQMPRAWSRANPVDIVGDADGARYAAALNGLADDRGVGAVLAMNVPTALTSSVEVARAIVGAPGAKVVPVIGCWIGGPEAQAGRNVLHDAGIPAYDTPLRAVRGFMHLVEYRRGQRALQRTPPSVPEVRSDTDLVRAIVQGALAEKRSVLTEPEAKRVLAAYGIPVVPTEIVRDAAGAAAAAVRIGFPVAVKILSRDITHKTDVGGVALDLMSEQAVLDAVREMTGKVLVVANKARIDGFVVQPMIRRPHAVELILGAAEDAVFGPIILVGHGGVAAEVIDDKALALPPLDPVLAEDALSRTRVDRLLRGYRDRAPADRAAVGEVMIRLSQLIADVGEIAELDINPLLADADGVIALDARIVVQRLKKGPERAARFAIRPYPVELETEVEHRGEKLRLRPIRPDDEPMLRAFTRRMTPEDVRMRFFGPLREMSHELAARLTQIDYDREMAFLLLEGGKDLVGVGRLVADPDFQQAEFALTVASDRQGRGYGELLLRHVLIYGKTRGIKRVVGHVLRENSKMLDLAKHLGFRRESGRSGEPDIRLIKSLASV